jgi:hypothetical protein
MFTAILCRGQYILLSFGLDFKASVKKLSIKINKGLFKRHLKKTILQLLISNPKINFGTQLSIP